MLYTAVLVACLTSAPTDCRNHEILIQSNSVPAAVFMEAQVKAAEWLASHPGLSQQSLVVRPGRSA